MDEVSLKPTHRRSSHHGSATLLSRVDAAWIFACLSVIFATGCRGRAHDDLYKQKMASEIRVLEDQLYEADYENRILADQLEQEANQRAAQDRQQASGAQSNKSFRERLRSRASENSDRNSAADSDRRAEDVLDMELDDLDLDDMIADGVSDSEFGSQHVYESPTPLEPAPTEPVPPGVGDTKIDPIIPGLIAPPLSPSETPDAPPGKIELKGVRLQMQEPETIDTPVPSELQLHPGFSGPHHFPAEPSSTPESGDAPPTTSTVAAPTSHAGMMLVVNLLDEAGRMMNLDNFDVDADMTVEAIDAKTPLTTIPLDAWKFTPEEVRKLVRATPVSGFHIPVRWTDSVHPSNSVIVRVTLQAGTDVMKCEAVVNLSESVSTARWTPRGDAKSR